MKYPMQIHTPESLQLAVAQAFEGALPLANEHGVGLVVVVVDASERVHYQTNLGPTMTAGMLSRCAGLYDAKPATPHGVPVALDPVPAGLVVGGPITTHGPGGGVAGGGPSGAEGGNASNGLYRSGLISIDTRSAVYGVVSDPPGAGGAGRTGGSHDTPPGGGGMSSSALSEPKEIGKLECRGCGQQFNAGDAYQLRVTGKAFAFHPGRYCPDCAARYDRGELVLPLVP